MMKKMMLLCSILSVMVGCGGSGNDIGEDDKPDEPILANQTILFYVQSNNSLYKQLWKDVNEIVACPRSNDGNNVLIFIDSEEGTDVKNDINGNWVEKQTKEKNQLFLVADGKLNAVSGFEAQFKGKKASDISTFKSVIEYCIEKYPAKKFALSLGSHGTGWAPVYTKSIGGNDFTDQYMEVKDIANALPIEFEYIILDACIMNNMATLYELRNKAKFIVASSMNTPANGFNYTSALKYFLRNDLVGACENYISTYAAAKFPATITVTETKYLEEVAAFNKRIFTKYPSLVTSVEQLNNIQKCETGWTYVDYVDLVDTYIGKRSDAADEIRNILDKVCYYKGWSGYQFREFEIDAKKYSGYAHWLNTKYFGDTYLNIYKQYGWYSAAGVDLYMPKINELYKTSAN